jgi:hypothetical protein
MKQISVILLFTVVILMSCNSSDEDMDVQKPIIESLTIESDSVGEKIYTNSNAKVKFSLSDDINLASWKIDIHDAFDGHAHGKIASEYSIIQAGNVSGKVALVEVALETMPSDATSGQYDCLINATDAAGNGADFKVMSFILSNGTEPKLELDNQNLGNVSSGSELNLSGELTDDNGLVSLEVFFESEDESVETELYEKDFDSNVLEFDLSEMGALPIPSDLNAGEYHLKFIAKDSDGNYMVEEVEVQVN